jgi:hypothetical protein
LEICSQEEHRLPMTAAHLEGAEEEASIAL